MTRTLEQLDAAVAKIEVKQPRADVDALRGHTPAERKLAESRMASVPRKTNQKQEGV